jgi:hypothetical protein
VLAVPLADAVDGDVDTVRASSMHGRPSFNSQQSGDSTDTNSLRDYSDVPSRLYEPTTAYLRGQYVAKPEPVEEKPVPKSTKYQHVPSRLLEPKKHGQWSGEVKPTKRVSRHPTVSPPQPLVGRFKKPVNRASSAAASTSSVTPRPAGTPTANSKELRQAMSAGLPSRSGISMRRKESPACASPKVEVPVTPPHGTSVAGASHEASSLPDEEWLTPELEKQLSMETVDSLLMHYNASNQQRDQLYASDSDEEEEEEEDRRILQLTPLNDRSRSPRVALFTVETTETRPRAESESEWWTPKSTDNGPRWQSPEE